MGFWDFLPGVGDDPAPEPAPRPKPAPKPALRTWKADRAKPPKGGTLSKDAWNTLDQVSQRTHFNLQVQQGGNNVSGDPTSKGTHDGGGAVDLYVKGMPKKKRLEVIAELRANGAAAWLRTPEYGWNDPNDEHIHAIFMNDPKLAPVARAQVDQYKRGLNGLANHAPDPFKDLKIPSRSKARKPKPRMTDLEKESLSREPQAQQKPRILQTWVGK